MVFEFKMQYFVGHHSSFTTYLLEREANYTHR